MAGTPATIDHDFVEEWAERYRCGALNTRWRPGPKLLAAMSAHPELQVLQEISDYWELEERIFRVIGASVRSTGSYAVPEFVTVGYWKTRRQLANYLKNEEKAGGTIGRVTGEGLASTPPPKGRVGSLCRLQGVRVRVASALLTVWRPDEFTIIDVWALKTLSQIGEQIDGIRFSDRPEHSWDTHYDEYLRACLGIVERVQPLTLRQVDQALWKWGNRNARDGGS